MENYVYSFLSVDRISVSAIMKKFKNGCHFIYINHTEKFQITDPPPKFGSPVFQVLTEMEYHHRPLWKNWKMAAISLILIVQKNLGVRFSKCQQKRNMKNGCHFVNIDHMEKFQITEPPKVWVSGFPCVNRNGISSLAIMKKLKNGCIFVNIDHTETVGVSRGYTDHHQGRGHPWGRQPHSLISMSTLYNAL